MEMTIAIYMVCENRRTLDVLMSFLCKETFPDFSDEVEPRYRALYEFLEGIEFPEVVKPFDENGVVAIWYESGETEQAMVREFNRNHCRVERFLLVGNEPIEEDAEGMLYVRTGNAYDAFILVQEEGMKTPMDFGSDNNDESLLAALLQAIH